MSSFNSSHRDGPMVYGLRENRKDNFYDNVFGKPFEQLSEGCYVRFKLLMSLKFVKNQGREWQCNAGSCVLVHNTCTLLFCCRSFQNSFKKCCHITEEGWVCNGDYCFWTNYYIYIYIYTRACSCTYVYIKENDVRWMDLRTVR